MTQRQQTSVKLTKAHLTNAERSIRLAVEEQIKGDDLSATPPKELTADQKKIYKWIHKELKPAQILSRLDLPTLKNACIIIDRLAKIDKTLDGFIEAGTIVDMKQFKYYQQIRNDYFTQYLRICTELCLSPTARARMGTLALTKAKTEEDPLMQALRLNQ